MVGLNKTAKERKIKLKKGIVKGKSIKIGFRKLIIDEQIWIWSKESRKLGNLSIKENSPTQNITKKKTNNKRKQRNKWKDLAEDKRLYGGNNRTAKTKENEKSKEEVIKKERKLN
jgi:hypothetical protein